MSKSDSLILKGRIETLKLRVKRKTIGKAANLYRRIKWPMYRAYPYANVYHCCTQKTASQWVKNVLKDPVVYRYTGLLAWPHEAVGLNRAKLPSALPRGTFGAHLYIDFSTFQKLKKPERYKAFFILRDPRDLVVSWYFSARYSHTLVTVIPEMRAALRDMELKQGLIYVIDKIRSFGTFDAMRSWVTADTDTRRVTVFKYEKLAENSDAFLEELFNFLEIEMLSPDFEAVCQRFRYKSLTRGREQGKENINSHFRKGIAGDWQNYFDEEITACFEAATGDLLSVLGYR
ncbi:MAG: sulfotransferase domain-containing protein [Microcoleaceae cyanobacterium]